MLVPHNPELDPRITCFFNFLKKNFDSEIVAIQLSNKNKRLKLTRKFRGTVIDYQHIYNYKTVDFFLNTWLKFASNLSTRFIIFFFRILNNKYFTTILINKKKFNDFYFFVYHLAVIFKETTNECIKKEEIDIIQCIDIFTLLPAVVLKIKHNGKLIYDAHELYSESLINPLFITKILFYSLEKSLLKYVDQPITVSEGIANIMSKRYGGKAFNIIHNAELLKENKFTLHRDDKIIFLYQGNFAPGRGIEKLLKLWDQLKYPHIQLILRGPTNQYLEDLKEKYMNVSNKNIKFEDPVATNMLVKAALKADVGIIPYEPVNLNYMYCFPNKLSQYMQAGLAILSNNLPCVKDIIKNHSCGLIFDFSQESTFFQAIDKLLSTKYLRKLQKASIKAAHDTLNWQQEEVKLKKIYANI